MISSNMLFNSLFSYKSKVYLFSNEPISLFLNDDSLKNKNVLAVLGSGDFLFNTVLLGCSNISLIDINSYAYYYFEIKKAIIKKYDYEDFICFYNNLYNLYSKFDEYSLFISEDVREDIILEFSPYCNDVKSLINTVFWSDIFLFDDDTNKCRWIDSIKKRNLYLNSGDNYKKLKRLLLDKDVVNKTFVCDIFDLNFEYLEHYDYIYLSNIGDYYDPQTFMDLLIRLRDNYLNFTGKIILIYRTDKYKFLIDHNFGKIINFIDDGLKNVIIMCSFD